MFTQEQLGESSKRRARVLMPVAVLAVAAVLIYFPVIGLVRDPFVSFVSSHFGEGSRELAPIPLILPAFAIFLVPMALADRYARRFTIVCPSCSSDVTRSTERLLKTRCCPSCEKQIVEGGRVRSTKAYKRYLEYRARALLKHWFWAWPILGASSLAWWFFDRSAFQECPNVLWVPSLVGTAAAGWAWLRTHDRRYVPQFLASVVLFALGATVFWRTT